MILFFVLIKVFNLSVLSANLFSALYYVFNLIRIADTKTTSNQGDNAKFYLGITFVVDIVSTVLFINYVGIPVSFIITYIIYIFLALCLSVRKNKKKGE